MKDLLIYDLKVVALIAVFYLLYRLLLHRSTLHRLNRMVLLGSLVLSLALPLCVITIHKTIDVSAENTSMGSSAVVNAIAEMQTASNRVTIPWLTVFSVIFLCGVAFMLLRFIWSVVCVLLIIRGSRQVAVQDGCRILVTVRKISAFSFGYSIVIPRSEWDGEHDVEYPAQTDPLCPVKIDPRFCLRFLPAA